MPAVYSAPPAHAIELRARVRDFLGANLDEELRNAARLTTGVYTDIDAGRRWFDILARQGWSAPTWPAAFGGTGWSALQRYLFDIECFQAGAPLLFNMGVRHIGPCLMAQGSPSQQAHYLPRYLSGTDVWCPRHSDHGVGGAERLAAARCEVLARMESRGMIDAEARRRRCGRPSPRRPGRRSPGSARQRPRCADPCARQAAPQPALAARHR